MCEVIDYDTPAIYRSKEIGPIRRADLEPLIEAVDGLLDPVQAPLLMLPTYLHAIRRAWGGRVPMVGNIPDQGAVSAYDVVTQQDGDTINASVFTQARSIAATLRYDFNSDEFTIKFG